MNAVSDSADFKRLILRNCLTSGGSVDVEIDSAKIISVSADGHKLKNSTGCDELDLAGKTVIPGMIDPHVHFRCPGASNKEDWVSGASAALHGGVTAVFDMPNNSPAFESMDVLKMKREAASEADQAGLPLKRFFWAGCSEDSIDELPALLDEPDVPGVKIFLSESSGNSSSSAEDFLRRVFAAASEAGKPVAVHSELAEKLRKPGKWSAGFKGLELHNILRPAEAAAAGTNLVLKLASDTSAKVYLCHVSTAAEIYMILNHKKRFGEDSVYGELTPHHLLLDTTLKVYGGPQSWARVNPPVRDSLERQMIEKAFCDALSFSGTAAIDLFGTDHAPHIPQDKSDDFMASPSGFPGLETVLPLAAGFVFGFSGGVNPESVSRLQHFTSGRAAEIFGISKAGKIEHGAAASLAVIETCPEYSVDAASFRTKAKYSPYNGMRLKTRIYKTITGGKIIG